jgi:hypothetical protein
MQIVVILFHLINFQNITLALEEHIQLDLTLKKMGLLSCNIDQQIRELAFIAIITSATNSTLR